MKNCIKIALVIIGALIGAGFASGQEIYLFFFSYGKKGILGIIISSILLGIIIYKTIVIIKEKQITTYKEFLKNIIPEKNRKEKILEIINTIINTFILITFYIMIAGFGGYLAETIEIPQIIGSSILAILFIIIIGIYTLSSTNIINKINEMEIVKGSNWLVSGVIYASYNSILLIPVLISINKIITKKEISKTAIIITLTTFILAISIFISMLKIDVNIRNLEMPVSYVINTQLPKLKIAYGIVILTSILTTAISLIAGLMQNVKNPGTGTPWIFLIFALSSSSASFHTCVHRRGDIPRGWFRRGIPRRKLYHMPCPFLTPCFSHFHGRGHVQIPVSSAPLFPGGSGAGSR